MIRRWFHLGKQGVAALAPLRGFFVGLAVSVAAALAAPEWGAKGGPLRTEVFTGWAVAGVFFLQGLQLASAEVRRGLGAWKVHLFCQAWMFLAYPLMAGLLVLVFGRWMDDAARTGLLYLAVLPTTIATCAAFAARAGGNGAVALFNIVVGNLAGVVLAPAVLVLLLERGSGAGVDPVPLFRVIGLQILLPFVVGQAARRVLARWAAARTAGLRAVVSGLIFFILYAAVCNLAAGATRAAVGGSGLAAGMALLLLCLGHGLAAGVLARTGWPQDLRVAAFYTASQKTLAAGVPMAGAVYAVAGEDPALPPLALVVLPLVVFHVGQLALGAVLIPVLARKNAGTPGRD